MSEIIEKPSAPFDYASLTPDERTAAETARDDIRNRRQRAEADIIEIGATLIVVKNVLGHGHFGAWLSAEFGWTSRTAQKLMQVAESFKCESGSHLGIAPSALYLLAGANIEPEAREEAVERAKAGETIDAKKAKAIANAAATRKGKPEPVKVTAKRKTDEPTSKADDFDAPNPFAEPEPAKSVAAIISTAVAPVADPEPAAPEPAGPDALPWTAYNAGLVDTAKDAESLARKIASVCGFDAKGQANVIYANGLVSFAGTVELARSIKRACTEAQIAEKRGNRFVTVREAKHTKHVSESRKAGA